MASLEMQRSQRTFQQWAVMDRSNSYDPKKEQTDWPADGEEKEEKGVELRLGLGLGGSSLCKIRDGVPETEWMGDAGSSKGLKHQFPGNLDAAIQLCLYERPTETRLDDSSLEIKAADFEAAPVGDVGNSPALPLPEMDGKSYGSKLPAIAGLSMEYESADSATNCLEPFKESLIQKAVLEQHRSSRDTHLQQQQLARKKRKMLLDEQKQQKKGKEDERACLIPRFQRPGSSAWASCWPKEAEKAGHSYQHHNLNSDQQMEPEKVEQAHQGRMEIESSDAAGMPHQNSPDDPDDPSSQPKELTWEGLSVENYSNKPFHRSDSLMAETTGKQDDPNTPSVSLATMSSTSSVPSYSGGNKFFLHPSSIPVLPYPYHVPFPPGSELVFPNTHFTRMISTTDAQTHNKASLPPTSVPFMLPATPSFAAYPSFQHLITGSKVSPLSKIQARASEDPSSKLQSRIITKERLRPASQQSEPLNNSICAIQSQASTSGLIHFGSSGPGTKFNISNSGNELLSRQRSANSAFTSLIAAVKASQGLSAAIAAISNSSPNIFSESQMVLESSAAQAQNGNISEQNHSEEPDITGKPEASEIPNKEMLPCVSQSGTTSNIPGLEILSRDPYNLTLGFASDQTFGGTGTSPDLPWVSTTGEGQNGKSVSGVVYRKHQGSIQIVCACHGKHMSPSEFVQHAGPEEMAVAQKGGKTSLASSEVT